MPRAVCLSLLALFACSPRGPASTADSATDTATELTAIRATLDGWYAAMQRADSAAILAPLTREFLLLEDTLPLSGAQLVARLKGDTSGVKWNAEFSDLRTRLRGDVAWTTLRNHETSRAPNGGKRCQADFLETIVFVRDDGRWLIDRYHAAALHPWSCAK